MASRFSKVLAGHSAVLAGQRRGLYACLVVLVVLLALPLPVVQVAVDGRTYTEVLSPFHGTPVELSYVHSVEKTRVEEEYDVRPSGIVMRTMAWQSFGAGLPDKYDEYVDGRYVKRTETHLGRTMSYWFLPINDVRLDIGANRVFEGPERESTMVLSVQRLPVIACVVALARSGDLPL